MLAYPINLQLPQMEAACILREPWSFTRSRPSRRRTSYTSLADLQFPFENFSALTAIHSPCYMPNATLTNLKKYKLLKVGHLKNRAILDASTLIKIKDLRKLQIRASNCYTQCLISVLKSNAPFAQNSCNQKENLAHIQNTLISFP